MNVKVATQTLGASVTKAIDFLHDEVSLPEFEGSEEISDLIRKIDILCDLWNSRNPFAKCIKQPVIKEYLPMWGAQCDELAR